MEYYIKLDNTRVVSYRQNYSNEETYSDEEILVHFTEEQISFLKNNFPFVNYVNNELTLNNTLKNTTQIILQKENRINDLKVMLSSSDYKITKCYEASLLSEEMPYNLEELLAQRKAWREEINALEFEISMLGN
jgi:hypothetical protein